MQKLRDSISKDLHDDVGSSLSTIQILSALLTKSEGKDFEKTKSLSEKINSITQSTMGNMADIVWAVNPANDSFETIIVKMKNHLAEMCEPIDVNFDIKIDNVVLNKKLTIAKRRDFYLLFKEAINNAVKYSKCTQISVNLSYKGGLQLVIKDNGIGFDEQLIKRGNGLNNMQARAAKIGGIYKITSKPNEGTTIHLKLNIT